MTHMRHARPLSLFALVAALIAAPLTLTATPAHAVSGTAVADNAYAFTARLEIGEGAKGDANRACSGALVDAQWVLTAVSCFADNPAAGLEVPAGAPALKTTATIGRTDLTTTTGQVRDVVQLVPHPDHDLVLAKLASPVSGITPVALSATAPAAGEELRVAGYGRTKDEWVPLRLHAGTFTVDSVSATEVAITGRDGAAVCKGDTGGPTFREAGGSVQLVGINSRSWQGGCFGETETETRTGAVNTRIDKVRTWINANLGPVCASSGALYSVTPEGSLLRRNVTDPANGTAAVPAASTIDTGWDQYPRVLAGNGATFYGIKADGLYFSHRVSSTGQWDVHHRQISTGFPWYRLPENRNKITIDRGGHIWYVEGGDDLRWQQYISATNSWNPAGNKKIDSGWGRFSHIVATDDGVVYGVDSATGHLLRSRYDFESQRWLQRHVTVSFADWRDSQGLTSFGGDVIMTVRPNGEVRHYRYQEAVGDFDGLYNRLIGSGSWWAGYTSVTGAPDSCRLRADYTPDSPAIDVAPFSPTSVMQASTGEIEYAFTDNEGRLVSGRQADPADFTDVRWTAGPANEVFTGKPQFGEQPDGKVALTVQNVNSEAWWRRHGASSSVWDGWTNLAGAMKESPVTAKRPDGVLVQFAVDDDGKPWYRAQQRPNVDFMGWIRLGGDGFAGPLTAVTVRDSIQLFGTDSTGQLRTANFKNGAVGSWTSLGDQKITHTPSVVVYPGYRLGVFARGTNGKIVTLVQAVEGTAYPAAWTQVGALTATGAPSAVIDPTTGYTAVVARSQDGTIHHTREEVQGAFGTWRAWQQASTRPSATDPTAFTYTSTAGSNWAYISRTDSNESHISQAQPGNPGRFTEYDLPAPSNG
ncbi:trypsin-like serine protease [Streptomyces sp. GMY02]|uniref:trypsin-like serine protease n=1 Tax=Streptomyces sp. GMY02 TaxID=1333528 RepID=UPI001C2BD5D0|nr:tachylectin-related carbohydrate-binding protein [Streptomyces sp. GMY02]QXE38285.1 trypsin-like serine protease [Streptomyces sp. GMY02]